MPSTDTKSYEYQERKKCIEKMDKILGPLPEYVSRYLYSKLNGPSRMQPRTALAYAGDLSLFFYYLSIKSPVCKNIPIKEIPAETLGLFTNDDMEEYYEWLACYERNENVYTNGPSAQKRKISSVSALYKYLMKKHYLDINPCDLMDLDRLREQPIIAMSDNQQAKFLDAVGVASVNKITKQVSKRSEKIKDQYTSIRDLAIAYVFLGTGIRVSELVAINLEDLNLTDNYFIITRKGGKHQQIYFGEEVAEVLNLYLSESRTKLLPEQDSFDYSALFLSLHHKRISVRQVENIVKDAAYMALPESEAKKISCHKLRSTYGTRLLKGSNSIALVAEVLGHKDISTTKRRYSAVQNLDQAPNYVSVLPQINDNVKNKKISPKL